MHVDRTTDKFSQGIQLFINAIQKEPLIDYVENNVGVKKRPYDSAELVGKFYQDMNIISNVDKKALD